MHSWHSRTDIESLDVPDWDTIGDITRDLQRALDELDVQDAGIPFFRAKIARTIAMLRDDKMLEQHVRKQAVKVGRWNVAAIRELVVSLEPPALDVY